MDDSALEEIVTRLAKRPGHETVRVLLCQLLTEGLGAKSTDIDLEKPLPEVYGRVDALLGRTVFEIKSSLKREVKDAEEQFARYLADRETVTKHRYVGIVTDGAEFRTYMLRNGGLEKLTSFKTNTETPRALLIWLESVVVVQADIPPDVENIRCELGRDSVACRRAIREIAAIWDNLKDNPEVNLKRDLWNRLLQTAHGADIADEMLFCQHTYLTIVAKAFASAALLNQLPESGEALLSGSKFQQLGIVGAVEPDFFDWLLLDPHGDQLVLDIARHISRFHLKNVQVDVLKVLYESLIDPEARHDLGEYYTPDWLAEKICAEAIKNPLNDRVIDPACGSGTFLFHAVRRLIVAAKGENIPPQKVVSTAAEKIAGIDIHPVAVIFARVTWLLALLPILTKDRPGNTAIPVYLGDSLQWNTHEFMDMQDLAIEVPSEKEMFQNAISGQLPDDDESRRVILRFPHSIVKNSNLFSEILSCVLFLSESNQPVKVLLNILQNYDIKDEDIEMLENTYIELQQLQKEGRNHIWGYVARNLSRPIWLSSEQQRADVVIGNPPWVAYRAMSKEMQKRFRDEMKSTRLWIGGEFTTALDLSAYFFARAAGLYMKKQGRIAFVMPYAAMTRTPYKLFRKGNFHINGYPDATCKFTQAWALPSDVGPLFPVPACVLFAERTPIPEPLPERVLFFSGSLPKRDANSEEASKHLIKYIDSWPSSNQQKTGSPYRKLFRNGATLFPRRLVFVERVKAGKFGPNPQLPLVRSRESSLDKAPWKNLPLLQEAVEINFIRDAYMGESLAPYRIINPLEAIIPWDEKNNQLLDAQRALENGHIQLSKWLFKAENLWDDNKKTNITLIDQFDYYKKLSSQFPISSLRVLYSKSGTHPAAAILRSKRGIVENAFYWTAVKTKTEAHYLTSILNSETIRSRAEQWQSTGQWGARHFSKVMFNLPIPLFDAKEQLHLDLAAAGREAEKLAARVDLKEGEHFTRARQRIRKALVEHGIAGKIDKLVARLLDGEG